MEGFAFQYWEIRFGKYGNMKNYAKQKYGNLDRTSFDKNGRKYAQKKHHAWAGCCYSFGATPSRYYNTAVIGTKVLRATPSPPPTPYP